ncbi:hypothetical protein G7Z17_g3933 [Cylindrodendrum hubeiense]|uniref:Calcium uniporter protein n=1 Tax=Cylindrodendrum hubeiense TaxID=595255 RepID=A0A9P5LHN5_9HYPO|nr:hypothetical protein G7Z17_g3933 [Cylindrodendrum hubeiense]
MSRVLCRATVRFSPALHPRPSSTLSSHYQHFLWSRVPVTSVLGRSFSRSRSLREEESNRKEDELREKARQREQRQVTSGKSAQTLENDRPWHRESSHAQPKSTSPDPTQGDLTKGRLLTTPTRLLKLILPMPFHPKQEHINEPIEGEEQKGETVEPLALLVHPHQPLSYLERLIQAEIPPLRYNGREKLPDIVFRAEADQEESYKKKGRQDSNVASYSGLGHEGPDRKHTTWVRWSGSTEVGDFIRDAARGREFAIVIEGHEKELRVAVPSFKDRTYYMRMHLRRMSREIDAMAKVKSECDQLAHKGAHRLAQGGFAALATWWGVVYYITFHTEMGWDLVEPVTYLAGLTTIMGGYLWFLFISRDLSYKAAMKVTVSKRQNALYQERGLDPSRWEHLVHEANSLRREIKMVAAEYDAEWDEMKDLGEDVKQVLEDEKRKNGGDKKEKLKDDDDDDDGEEAPSRADK